MLSRPFGGLSASAVEAAPSTDSYNYSPAQEATIAAGDTETLTFRGQAGNLFGFDRILAGGDVEAVTATATTKGPGGDVALIQNAHLSALRDLMLYRRLRGLLYIPESNPLRLELTNRSGASATVNVQLSGYASQAALEEQEDCLAAAGGGELPQVDLVTAFADVPAGTTEQRLDIARAQRLEFRRFMVGTSDPDSVRVQLSIQSDVVKQKVYASQIRDEYLWHEAPRPYVLDTSTPLSVLVDNTSGQSLPVSVVFEAYAA